MAGKVVTQAGGRFVGDIFESKTPLSKSDVTAMVEKRFQNLGGEALELVIQLALSPRRMRSFLTHLKLDPDRDLKAQLDVLFFYLARQTDLRAFLARARIELSNDMREPAKMAYDALEFPVASKLKGVGQPVPAESARPKAQSQAPTPLPPVAGVTPVAELSKPVSGAMPAPAPLAGIIPLDEQSALPPLSGIVCLANAPNDKDPAPTAVETRPEVRERIEEDGYSGPCRRIGPACRRRALDRRRNVNSVMSNRRFGGDRRKSAGRRKSDPKV